jgi:excisionase family DNA binding protein
MFIHKELQPDGPVFPIRLEAEKSRAPARLRLGVAEQPGVKFPGQARYRDVSMRRMDEGLRLSKSEIAAAFADPVWGQRFPPVMTVDEVAELLRVPKATVYDWSSRGLLRGCSRRVGKHLRFHRDRLVERIFNDGFHAYER